jgi:hypothetical protein
VLRAQEALGASAPVVLQDSETSAHENVPAQRSPQRPPVSVHSRGSKNQQLPSMATQEDLARKARKPKNVPVWGEDVRPVVATDAPFPVIRGVMPHELEAAPQYVKGRLTVERVNSVVATLDKVISGKYSLLNRPLRSLSSQDAARWHEITAAESNCPEVEGRPFFTDADIRSEGVAMDSTLKSAINILRHVSILKELRGKNRVRVFVILGH